MSRFLTDIMSKKAQEKPKLEVVPKSEDSLAEDQRPLPSSTNLPQVVTSSIDQIQVVPTPPKYASEVPISPARAFTKVPNSLAEEAIPQGMFKGLSKLTYDVLYKMTRGAINPTRKIQLTQLELMKLTGVSENTLRSHIKYLSIKGFLKVSYQIGKHEGAIYEVFIPEEIEGSTNPSQVLPSGSYSQPLSRSTDTSQELVLGTSQNLGGVGTTLSPENIEQNDSPRLKKDNTKTEDERAAAFSGVIEKFDTVSRKLTGKGISKRDAEKWSDFADLIVLELEIAAKRTNAISSIPAFLTEVLRRQLFAQRQQQKPSAKSSKTKTDTVGKADSDSYEIKPLDEKGREAALEQLREFAEDDFLQDFKRWYTEEDWQWLITELGIK